MNNQFIIYGLVDPYSKHLRYVGKSQKGLKRPLQHFKPALLKVNTHKNHWIKQLLSQGSTPQIVIIQSFEDADILNTAEIHWIAYFKSMGCPLTNLTEGGDGTRGYVFTEEVKQRMSASSLGFPKSVEHAANISAGKKGVPKSNEYLEKVRSEEHRIKMRDMALKNGIKPSAACHEAALKANLGVSFSTERKAKLSAAHKGVSLSPEHIKHVSEALKGRKMSPEAVAKSAISKQRAIIDSNGKIYSSIKEAAQELKVSHGAIGQALRNGGRCQGLTFSRLKPKRVLNISPEGFLRKCAAQVSPEGLAAQIAGSSSPIIDQNGKIYPSLKVAASIINCNPKSLWKVLNNKQKTIYGYTFKYLEKEE